MASGGSQGHACHRRVGAEPPVPGFLPGAHRFAPRAWVHPGTKGPASELVAFAAGHAQRVQYAAVFGRAGERVEVYIDNTDSDWNETLFDRLNERRESIEGEFGTELVWSRLEERRATRIAILREGSIDDDDRVLDGVRAWMIERLLAFKRVFGPLLDELTTELG